MDASPLFASFVVMYLFLSLNRINKTIPALSSCFSTYISFFWHLFVIFMVLWIQFKDLNVTVKGSAAKLSLLSRGLKSPSRWFGMENSLHSENSMWSLLLWVVVMEDVPSQTFSNFQPSSNLCCFSAPRREEFTQGHRESKKPQFI